MFGAPISPKYDLSVALNRTEQGIHNFYSTEDTTILRVATTLAGTMDKHWGVSAGAVGFRTPPGIDAAAGWAYQTRLVQHPYTDDMQSGGHRGGHYGWAKRKFNSRWVAPLLTTDPTAGAKVVRLPEPPADAAESTLR